MSKDLDKNVKRMWRDVPGYDGRYKANTLGEVAKVTPHGLKIIKPFVKHRNNLRVVNLVCEDGKRRQIGVANIMANTFMGGYKTGCVLVHKNKDKSDNRLVNLQFTSHSMCGQLYGGDSRRIPVVKINSDGEIVACYKSAREAGRCNYLSYQTVLDRCHGGVKNEFALDGYSYRFDEVAI